MVFPESIQAIRFFLKMETAETIAEGLQPNYHDKTDQSGLKKTYFSLKKRLSL